MTKLENPVSQIVDAVAEAEGVEQSLDLGVRVDRVGRRADGVRRRQDTNGDPLRRESADRRVGVYGDRLENRLQSFAGATPFRVELYEPDATVFDDCPDVALAERNRAVRVAITGLYAPGV